MILLRGLEFALLGSLSHFRFFGSENKCCYGVEDCHGGGHGAEEAESVDGSNGLPEVCAEQTAQAAADAKVKGPEIVLVYVSL